MEAHHTRRYLQALLVPSPAVTSSSSNSKGPSTSTTSSTASQSSNASSKGDEEGEEGGSATASDRSETSETETDGTGSVRDAADDARRNGREGTKTSSDNTSSEGISSINESNSSSDAGRSSTSSKSSAYQNIDVESRSRKVIDLLADESLDDDKPEKLKELLMEVTVGTESATLDMDAVVLALMHRFREDAAPTGQTFNSPTPMPRTTGSLSRSSSFRRTLTPSSAGIPALRRSGIATPTRPISPSPLRAQSPSVFAHRTNDPFAHVFEHADYTGVYAGGRHAGPGSSAPSSPFGSPRMLNAGLNAGASEFRPNASASEFKPSTPSLTVKMPDFKPRSPVGTPLTESSPTVWAFQNSPLGTPKFASSTVGAAAAGNGNSYFGSVTAPSVGTPGPAIPSDPWNNFNSSSTASSASNPGISQSSSTASSEGSHEDNSSDLFGGSGNTERVASGKSQILESSEDEDEWGIPTTSYEDATRRGLALGESASPRWDLYGDEDEDEDLAMLSITGGKLVPDDLSFVEPPVKQRPVFDEQPQPQSTAQYSQLPQDYAGLPGHQGSNEMHMPVGMTGLNAPSGNYVMTPFDVLYSVFSESDISPAELEEALSKSGWDVDKAMEWIINNSRLAGGNRGAEAQLDNLHMFSNMDLNDRPSSAGGGFPSPRQKSSMGSGSRPLIVSRDSFQRSFSGIGRPSSPRWASGPNTPGGRSDRSGAEGYFPSTPGAGSGPPSTRLCKYYLQGNCLRSDCRFSHDLSKAVCKFWLRGHCLKGEGRCEFLHSVPPHLASDVAQLRAHAIRSRENEKSRWLGRPGEEEDGQMGGRVEEDFPSLAAATASASSRALGSGAGGPLSKDPATTRWAGAVKNGRPVSQLPVNSRPSLPRLASGSRAPGRAGERSAPFSQPRQSARLALRPPTLLPTISTGAAVSRMYETYRQQFFEYGNARNKCLVKAAACFRAGDGAGAKRWSREAQEWNRQIATKGVAAAGKIVSERRQALKEAVLSGERPGIADEQSDRQYRGQECGSGLGVCLGVAAAGESLGPEGARLSAAERTEVALDLHGLHPTEGVEILERFLLGLANEGVMRGLAFVIVGQERHTGSADPNRGSRKLRLIDAVGQWLDSYGYAFWFTQGILAIDPYL